LDRGAEGGVYLVALTKRGATMKTILVRFEQVLVPCVVVEEKNAYGNKRILVEPVSGVGRQWVDEKRAGSDAS